MKRGKDQPNPETAKALQKEATGISFSQYNPVAHAFLSKMPGVDSRNVYLLLNRCGSFTELAKMTLEELTEVMENSQMAKALYDGLHTKVLLHSKSSTENSPSKSKNAKSGPDARFKRRRK